MSLSAPRSFLLWFNLALLLILFFLRGQILSFLKPAEPLPVYGQLQPFILTDERGQPVTLESLKENIWIMNFMFTRCPNQCPRMSFKMSALQKVLPKNIHFVSVSVEPEHDTPTVLAEYAKRFKAERGRWIFLTGGKTESAAILKSAHLGDSGEPSMHSLRLILIDKNGSIRGYYNSEEEAPIENLRKDIQKLL